jgi:hypothetical protein
LRLGRFRGNLSEKKSEKQNSPVNGKKFAENCCLLGNPGNPEKKRDTGKSWGEEVMSVNTADKGNKVQKKVEKSGKATIKRMIFLILISNTSRYPWFKGTKLLPAEITSRGTVTTHPHSIGVPKIDHRMKVSLQILAQTLIWR